MKKLLLHFAYVTTLTIILLGYAHTIHAAEMSIETSSVEPYTGDELIVSIVAHSNESINTAGATIVYPKDKLSLKEIRDGNSSIHFWIQKELLQEGTFSFSGITAGGFTGPHNTMISLVFTVTAPGDIPLVITDASLLRNDGSGSNAITTIRNKVITSRLGEDNPEVQYSIDGEAPEYFTPEIVRDQNIHDGAPVLVFATQDKGSGMSHYEVREGWFDFFTRTESPHLLKDEQLRKTIYVKAIDLHGNERLVTLPATNPVPPHWYAVHILVTLAVITAILYVVKKVWRAK